MLRALSDRIWSDSGFQEAYTRAWRAHVAKQFEVEPRPSDEEVAADLAKLLECACHFSMSADARQRTAAYRIGIVGWSFGRASYPGIGRILALIFGRLGHFPAITHLYEVDQTIGDTYVPLQLWLEVEARRERNTVEYGEHSQTTLTDFQRDVWEALASGASVAVSAPTSAGKSYVMQRFLVGAVLSGAVQWAIYLVPTRALISQVAASLSAIAAELGGRGGSVLGLSTIPLSPSELGLDRGVYVLTQERAKVLLNNGGMPAVGFVVTDEAQGIGDGARGVLLFDVLEALKRLKPDAQFLFASPQVENQEVFGETLSIEGCVERATTAGPVAQNLILVNQVVRHPGQAELVIVDEDRRLPVGRRAIAGFKRGDGARSLAAVASELGKGARNLVYCNGPAECERTAALIVDHMRQTQGDAGEAGTTPDGMDGNDEVRRARLGEFHNFLVDEIHPEYGLARLIEEGVGFHYGPMPTIVRRAVEEYFTEGLLKYLVCTSTLLHGVNLPARNLFMLKPRKGQNEPLAAHDFWNLAGRAGRLRRDFEGNVFLVSHEEWARDPLQGPRLERVRSATNQIVVDGAPEFLAFVRDRTHATGAKPGAENAFGKLVSEAVRGTLSETLDRMFGSAKRVLRGQIERAVNDAVERAAVPLDIVQRNSGISLYRQEELMRTLRASYRRGGVDAIAVVHPRHADAYNVIARTFEMCVVSLEHESNRAHRFFALIAREWMTGTSYRRMIEGAIGYRRDNGQASPSVDKVVREMIDAIENGLRYRYVKYVTLYEELARAVLVEMGHEQAAERMPSMQLYLEVGACDPGAVALIGMGFTRTTATALASLRAADDWSPAAMRAWLAGLDVEAAGLSRICAREVLRWRGGA